MDIEERIKLVLQYPTEEILTIDELRHMFETGHKIRHYIGFEISGYVHVGTGIACMSKIVDLQRAGVKTSILLADLHSWLNNKLGGDLETIRKVAVTYFKETLKKCIEVLGGDPESTEFYMASEVYEKNPDYWYLLLDYSRLATLSEVRHSLTILGRKAGSSVPMAWLIYPLMQVADVFILEAHIAHGGIDQRKAYVLARDLANKSKIRKLKLGEEEVKPVALFHRLLPALTPPKSRDELSELKMSKSIPESAIFLHEDPETIRKKIQKAYCPPREIENNPIIELARLFSFREERKTPLVIERPQEYGGGRIEIWTFEELCNLYKEGKIHPLDLKNAIAEEIIRKLEPITRWFKEGQGAKLLQELQELMKITR
ncbi:MAG: tyrosine--tRNA ligase [Crenarchaeota archaeon]|nr:tyrosine--tRNA ligase [Thermoproteota archaeon]